MDLYSQLKAYTELPGPSGHEDRVQQKFMEDIEPYVDSVSISNVGNVIAHREGPGKKVVVFGHSDEVAYFILSITSDGFLHISKGRTTKVPFPYALVGQKALVLGDKGDVRGAFVSTAGHVLQPQEKEKPLETWNVLVDIGASSREEVEEKGVHVGCPVIWNPTTERLGKKVFGKAMDDRFTYPVMIEVAKKLQGEKVNSDLYFASTVQEEVGLRGSQALSRLGFDVSLALDIGIAGDYPTLPEGRMPIRLGEGPVIAYRDGSIVYSLEVIEDLKSAAEEKGIPYQHGVFERYSSDSVSMIAGGAKPALLCTPCRYSHSPVEMIHLDDLENLVKLLYNYLIS